MCSADCNTIVRTLYTTTSQLTCRLSSLSVLKLLSGSGMARTVSLPGPAAAASSLPSTLPARRPACTTAVLSGTE